MSGKSLRSKRRIFCHRNAFLAYGAVGMLILQTIAGIMSSSVERSQNSAFQKVEIAETRFVESADDFVRAGSAYFNAVADARDSNTLLPLEARSSFSRAITEQILAIEHLERELGESDDLSAYKELLADLDQSLTLYSGNPQEISDLHEYFLILGETLVVRQRILNDIGSLSS